MRVQRKARTLVAMTTVAALSAVAVGIYALRSLEGDGPGTSASTRSVAPANECDPMDGADEKITPRLTTAAQATDSTLSYAQYNPPDKNRPSLTDDVRCKQRSKAADQD
jgi:hypothetical protein